MLTLESVDLKHLHIHFQRLKNGVSSQKPLWRHNAKLLRSYFRVCQNAGQGIEYVADHLDHKNIQNTRICAQITTSLRHKVFAKLGRHLEIVRVA